MTEKLLVIAAEETKIGLHQASWPTESEWIRLVNPLDDSIWSKYPESRAGQRSSSWTPSRFLSKHWTDTHNVFFLHNFDSVNVHTWWLAVWGGVFCGEIDSTIHPTLFKGDIEIRVLLNNRAVYLLSSCIKTFDVLTPNLSWYNSLNRFLPSLFTNTSQLINTYNYDKSKKCW